MSPIIPSLPPNAKKVFTGVVFDVYHWDQEMFDGTTETFEILERQASVNVVATVGDKIIVLWQEQPRVSLFPGIPGGGIEEDELPEEATRRELLEESGFSSESLELWQLTNSGGRKIIFPDYLFIARNCQKVAEQKLDAGEKITVSLVSFEEFLELGHRTDFSGPLQLKFDIYEALLHPDKKEAMRKKIYGV